MSKSPFWPSLAAALLYAAAVSAQVAITTPADQSVVCPITKVTGQIDGAARSAANGELWIVVHPMLIGSCWVQAPASIGSTGKWTAYIHFGERIADHDGKPFEFKAMVLTARPTVGKTTCWPASAWSSPVTSVTRDKLSNCP